MSKIHTIYLIHHSHTDIGFTHDQPVVWDLHTRFIDTALDLAEQYADQEGESVFRWTVETTGVLKRWLQTATSRDIDRLIQLERAGRVEVTAMFANITPLYDTDQLIESFQILRRLREDYGFNIQSAMNCDVNGENWPLVDVLLDLGIHGFTMAINTHFGGAVTPRPFPFYWQSPSGRKLLTYNGWTYDKGITVGLGRSADDLAKVWWPRLEAYLERIQYPLPILMLQSYHPYGDNGSAFGEFTPFIDAWNEAGNQPQIIMATPRMWWAAVEEHSRLLTTYCGDWTDYWNFGSISSAREETINRASRARLRSADALYAAVANLPVGAERRWTGRSFQQYREAAWEAVNLWDEHTWGADVAIRTPESEDTASQWQHKAHYAYTGRSLSLLLQRDAVAELAQHVQRSAADDLLVFNPLPWTRVVEGAVPHFVLFPRGMAEDTTAGRQHQDRDDRGRWMQDESSLVLPPTEIPGYGYAVVPRATLVSQPISENDADTIENDRFRLVFDRHHGGIRSWYDKQLNREWVEPGDWAFNGFVHEQVADTTHPWPRNLLAYQDWRIPEAEIPRGWQPDWQAKRSTPTRVLSHKVLKTSAGYEVIQQLEAPGCIGPLTQRVFLPVDGEYIECSAEWDMGLSTHPEATYILFPFNLSAAVARFDLGGQPVMPGVDQLPGSCRDYFTVQGWVDFAGQGYGVTVALPDNPMVQLGDFHFAHNQSEFKLERALLLGWVTNNYWETNFRAHQPGRVTARYRLMPYAGAFDEARAHRFGLEAAYARPVYQHLGEPPFAGPSLPARGSLLQLPTGDVLTLHIKATQDGKGFIVRLLNASDQPQQAQIGSGIFHIVRAAQCNLLEQHLNNLSVEAGLVSVDIPPRQIATVNLQTDL